MAVSVRASGHFYLTVCVSHRVVMRLTESSSSCNIIYIIRHAIIPALFSPPLNWWQRSHLLSFDHHHHQHLIILGKSVSTYVQQGKQTKHFGSHNIHHLFFGAFAKHTDRRVNFASTNSFWKLLHNSIVSYWPIIGAAFVSNAAWLRFGVELGWPVPHICALRSMRLKIVGRPEATSVCVCLAIKQLAAPSDQASADEMYFVFLVQVVAR